MKSPFKYLLFFLTLSISLTPALASSSRGSRSSSHRTSTSRSKSVRTPKVKAPKPAKIKASKSRNKCVGCPRDSEGRIKRSESAKNAFKRSNPCPATGKTSGPCKGYVIDHITPLAKGGKDDSSNMQWQTKAAVKEKDKWERKR